MNLGLTGPSRLGTWFFGPWGGFALPGRLLLGVVALVLVLALTFAG